MRSDNSDWGARQGEISLLRQSIQRAFPAETYTGKVTPYDDKLDDPDLDEEKGLYEMLKGRKWTDIPQRFLDSKPDGYFRLTDEAFRAFLGAWLMYSLENIDGENRVRNFVVYAFSPKDDMVPNTTDHIRRKLEILNPDQRQTLRSLLMEFSQQDPSAFRRKLASDAVVLIDTLH